MLASGHDSAAAAGNNGASMIVPGTVRLMFEGKPVQEPWLQFLQLKIYEKPNGGGVHYKIVVSDGQHFIQGTLTPQLNYLVSEKKLEPFCVAQILKYSVSQLKDHRLIFISEISLNGIAYGSHKIGGPVNVENDPNITTFIGSAGNNTTNNYQNNSDMAPKNPASAPSTAANPLKDSGNLVTMAGSADEVSIQPISSISPYHNRYSPCTNMLRWVIKARVGTKSEIKKFTNNKGEGKLFSCVLLDESGEIKVTAFGDAVDKFFDVIIPGKVYVISNAACKMSKRQFSNVNNDYEIHLEPGSVVQLAKEDAVTAKLPSIRYSFCPIASLATQEKDKFVDVIGVAAEIGEAQSLTAKSSGRQLDKRDILLVDQSLSEIKLTLWGHEALAFSAPFKASCIVIAAKGVKVGEYQGGKTLSTVSSSTLMVDPDISEAHRLRGWYDACGSNLSKTNKLTNLSSTSSNPNAVGSDPRKTLSQIKDENLGRGTSADYFSTLAAIQHCRSEEGKVWYEACPQEGCSKKVIAEGPSQYRCERCQRVYDHCCYRYILSVQIADHTDSCWVNVFGEQGEQLLGVSAEQLHHIKEQGSTEEYEKTIKECLQRHFVLRMRAKAENYQGEDRVRLNVVALSRIDPVKEGLAMMQSVLSSKA